MPTEPRRLRFPAANAGFHMAALGLGRCNASDPESLLDAAAHMDAAARLCLEAAARMRAVAQTEDPAALRLFKERP